MQWAGGEDILRKDVYERYLEVFKSRKYDTTSRDTATEASTSGVYYTQPMAARPSLVMQNKFCHAEQSEPSGR